MCGLMIESSQARRTDHKRTQGALMERTPQPLEMLQPSPYTFRRHYAEPMVNNTYASAPGRMQPAIDASDGMSHSSGWATGPVKETKKPRTS